MADNSIFNTQLMPHIKVDFSVIYILYKTTNEVQTICVSAEHYPHLLCNIGQLIGIPLSIYTYVFRQPESALIPCDL